MPLLLYGFIFLPVAVLVLFSFQGTLFPDPALQRPVAALVRGGAERSAADLGPRQFACSSRSSPRPSPRCWAFSPPGASRASTCPASAFLRGLITLPLTVSYLIIGMGLLILFNWIGMPKSLLAAGIGHVVINLPLCFAIIYSQMGDHQANIERAARDLGASEWQVLLLVTAPMLWPALFASFFLSMTFSWDEFVISFLLTRFDTTLPVEIWNLLRSGLNPKTNAVGSLVFGVSIVLAIIFELVAFRKRPHDGARRHRKHLAQLRRHARAGRCVARHRARQLHGAARALGLGQDDAALDPRRLPAAPSRAAC